MKNGVNGPIELYDLKTDLGEKHDLAAEHPDLVKRFADFFKSARVDSPIWPIREKPRDEGQGQGGGVAMMPTIVLAR